MLLGRGNDRLIQRACRFADCKVRLRLLSTVQEAAANDDKEQSSLRPTLASMKQQLLETSLQNVHHYGWTQDAILQAVLQHRKAASLSIAGLVTPNDLIRFAMDDFQRRLEQDLASSSSQSTTTDNNNNNSPTDRIIHAMQVRLSYQRDYMESQTWQSAMALGASPTNAMQTQQQLKTLMDYIVKYSYGSASLSELSKLTLGGVYLATELHMLADTSVDYQDTWEFLRQRLGEWETATSMMPSVSSDSLFVSSAVASAFASGLASLVFPATSLALANVSMNDLQRTVSQVSPNKLRSAFAPKNSGIDVTDPRFYKVDDKYV